MSSVQCTAVFALCHYQDRNFMRYGITVDAFVPRDCGGFFFWPTTTTRPLPGVVEPSALSQAMPTVPP